MFIDGECTNFYVDPEIYQYNTSFPQSAISNAKILTFPTKDKGAFAASLPADGIILDTTGSFSLPSWVDSEDSTKPANGDHKLPNVTSAITSAQVSQFWEIYQAYPQYLKKVSRKRRKKNLMKKDSAK